MAEGTGSNAKDEREDESRHDRGSGGDPLCAINAMKRVGCARGQGVTLPCSALLWRARAKPEEGDEQERGPPAEKGRGGRRGSGWI